MCLRPLCRGGGISLPAPCPWVAQNTAWAASLQFSWTNGVLQERGGENSEVGTLGGPVTPKGARFGMLPGL